MTKKPIKTFSSRRNRSIKRRESERLKAWEAVEAELKDTHIWLHWHKGQLIIDADTTSDVLIIFFEEVAKFIKLKHNDT